MNLDFPQGRSVAAGEYVLGTLTADERHGFEAALPQDRELLAEVYRWQDRLLSLALRVVAIEPAGGGWEAIQAQIARQEAPVAEPRQRDEAVDASAQAPARAPDEVQAQAQALGGQALRLWKAIAALALAACLVLATLLLMRGPAAPGQPPERYLSLLQASDKTTGWLVEVTAGQRLRLLPLASAAQPPAGQVLHGWVRLDGAAGATSLGRVSPHQPTELTLERLPGSPAQWVFELTLEPEAAAPGDLPSGPVLYSGRSLRL